MAPLFATVLHLSTGHVLAAIASVGLEPTLEQVTGEDGVRVRFPNDPGFVNVPMSALTATRLAVTADALDRAQNYAVSSGTLVLGDRPEVGAPASTPPADTDAVVVWQDGEESVVVTGKIQGTTGEPPGEPPPGATHQLLAAKGFPLNLKAI
jgi:hypothetical protein